MTGGVVTGITITSGGTGYTSNPTVTISNPTSNAFVEVGATVQLFRTPVDPHGNPTGPTVLANTLTNTAGGIVAIADVNLGNATTHDTQSGNPGRDVRLHGDGDRPGGQRQPDQPAQRDCDDRHQHAGHAAAAGPGDQHGRDAPDDVTDANNSATTATATATIDSLGTVITIAVTSGGSGYYERESPRSRSRAVAAAGRRPPPS